MSWNVSHRRLWLPATSYFHRFVSFVFVYPKCDRNFVHFHVAKEIGCRSFAFVNRSYSRCLWDFRFVRMTRSNLTKSKVRMSQINVLHCMTFQIYLFKFARKHAHTQARAIASLVSVKTMRKREINSREQKWKGRNTKKKVSKERHKKCNKCNRKPIETNQCICLYFCFDISRLLFCVSRRSFLSIVYLILPHVFTGRAHIFCRSMCSLPSWRFIAFDLVVILR